MVGFEAAEALLPLQRVLCEGVSKEVLEGTNGFP